MVIKNSILAFLLLLSMVVYIHAQSKGNVFVAMRMESTVVDPVTGEYPDMTWVHALEDSGYQVTSFYTPSLAAAGQDTMDILNSADLVVLGRSVPTTTLGANNADDKVAWNSITAPLITGNMWAMRSSRLNWFNTTSITNYTDSTLRNVLVIQPPDAIFDGLGLNTTDPLPWWDGQADELGIQDPGSGILIAVGEATGNVAFVRFDPDVEFYNGTTDVPAGYRSYIGNGRDNSSQPPFSYFNFTPEGKKVFYAEVANLIKLGGGPHTGVKYRGDANLPSTLVLSQNYPNPFNPTTQIQFSIPARAFTNLTVYNALGQEIETLVNNELNSGKYTVTFNAGNLPSGIYLYQIHSGNFNETRKMMLIK